MLQVTWIREECRDDFGPRNIYPSNNAIRKQAEKVAKQEGRGNMPASMVVLIERQVCNIHHAEFALGKKVHSHEPADPKHAEGPV